MQIMVSKKFWRQVGESIIEANSQLSIHNTVDSWLIQAAMAGEREPLSQRFTIPLTPQSFVTLGENYLHEK